jgi:predicted P-loop ATPase
MTTPLAASVSIFQGSTRPSPITTLPLDSVLQQIQDGSHQTHVESLRHLLATNSEAWYKDLKKRSMAFTPAGVFARRANAKLTTPSGLLNYDFDHLSNCTEAKARLSNDPYIVYAFDSPSGEGLKVAVWADGIVDDATYKHAWRTVLAYFERTYPDLAVANDKACKDISRLCYVSWDPDLYRNPNALRYAVPPYQPPASSSKPAAQRASAGVAHPSNEQGRVETALKFIPADDRSTWLNMGMALHASGEPWARAVWDTWSQTSNKYDVHDQDRTWQSFKAEGGITLATLFHEAQKYGSALLERIVNGSPPHAGHTPTWNGTTLAPDTQQPQNAPTSTTSSPAESQKDSAPRSTWVSLKMAKDRRPRPILSNILEVLEHDPRWEGVVGYNELTDDITLLKRPPYATDSGDWPPRLMRDGDYSEASNWLQRQYDFCAATTLVTEGLQTFALRFPYHPVYKYLAGLIWDGVPRIDSWLTRYCQAADTPYIRAVGAKTLIAAVARVEKPGCKADTVTILEGDQGILKSTVWRVLASDAWFSDSLPDLHDKDAAQSLRGKWIVELGELAVLHRSEGEAIKRFISANQDHYRPSYGRRAATFPRQNIFVGSTNNDTYLKDVTGNRRFWPVALTGVCDIAALQRDRDQLWGEAYVRYHAGEAWHLTPELEQLATQEQEARVEVDDWEAPILEFLDLRRLNEVTTRRILIECFHFENPALWTPTNSKRVGAILRRNGWRYQTIRISPTTVTKGFKRVTPRSGYS